MVWLFVDPHPLHALHPTRPRTSPCSGSDVAVVAKEAAMRPLRRLMSKLELDGPVDPNIKVEVSMRMKGGALERKNSPCWQAAGTPGGSGEQHRPHKAGRNLAFHHRRHIPHCPRHMRA